MPLTPEQVEEIKRQIFEQTKNFPEEKRKEIEEQINRMSPEELEIFVKQQMEAANQNSPQTPQTQKGVYRLIVDGELPSKKIDENPQAIAVLDIKPISKGHSIIIPKKAVTDTKTLPSQCFTLAKKLAKRLSSKLKASATEIQTQFAFGEIIINVIPVYDKPLNINSPRSEATEEELSELYEKLKPPKKLPVIRKKTKKSTGVIKLKQRIP